MIFVYLKDGRRVDVPEAESVIQRGLVMFLDREDQIIRQMSPEEILAYSHVPYEEDERDRITAQLAMPPSEPQAVQMESDALLLRRRRHRSSPRHASS
jgi:hypothetical protein